MPVHLVDHPLVHDALASLRNKHTTPERFRRAATRISVLLAAEALRDIATVATTVETPLGPAVGAEIGADVVVVPVLRAGLGMLDAVLELVPRARVGHIGLQRDEMTAVASQYYSKLPPRLDEAFVVDHRSHAGDRRQRGGRAGSAAARGRARHPDDLHRRRPGRHRARRAAPFAT